MVAMIVRIQYACVAEIHRLKIKRIYNNAWWKRVLIWASASLIVIGNELVNNHV